MGGTQQALAGSAQFAGERARRPRWFGGLHGADYVWAIAFALPYIAIFLAFVVYPIGFGIWMGSDPALYERAVLRSALPDAPSSTRCSTSASA